jgi:hypothetical protein
VRATVLDLNDSPSVVQVPYWRGQIVALGIAKKRVAGPTRRRKP